MTPRPVTVHTELQLRLVVPGAPPMPVRATLRYDAADPYALQIGFYTGCSQDGDVVEWTFARQLLTDGVAGPVGQGDVQVWPSTSAGEAVACLSLSSPSGHALFELPLPELVDFLTITYEAVPTGSEGEFVDVDSEFALLLWAEPGT
jgi:hypothetical protein